MQRRLPAAAAAVSSRRPRCVVAQSASSPSPLVRCPVAAPVLPVAAVRATHLRLLFAATSGGAVRCAEERRAATATGEESAPPTALRRSTALPNTQIGALFEFELLIRVAVWCGLAAPAPLAASLLFCSAAQQQEDGGRFPWPSTRGTRSATRRSSTPRFTGDRTRLPRTKFAPRAPLSLTERSDFDRSTPSCEEAGAHSGEQTLIYTRTLITLRTQRYR